MNTQPRTKRIAFVGGPGSGKSTTSADLFVQLKKLGKNAELVTEWIRRDIMRNGPMRSTFEQYRTMMHTREAEENFPAEVEYLICDGNTLLNYFYAVLYGSKSDTRDRLVLQDMYTLILDDLYTRRYDHIYFLPRIHTASVDTNDGTRIQTIDDMDRLENHMKLFFTEAHQMDNLKILDCELSHRNGRLLTDLLGPINALDWSTKCAAHII